MSSAVRPLLALLLLCSAASAQSATDDSWKVYSDSSVARIDITMDPAAIQWMYAHEQSDSEHVVSVRFRNAWLDETIDSVGFRLRGNTSRTAKKKSFKVSFNSFISGRKFHGVEKLNLNGEHNDPSIIRSKLSFDLFRDLGITASRTSHARVYINGGYYGVYVSVEHVDENFLAKRFADDGGNLWKCLYPADLKYLGMDPQLYKAVMNNATTRAYDLSTNETADDYTALVRLITIVNNASDAALPDSLERVMDIQRLLQYNAVNTLVSSWDDYRSLMNNYYLYLDPLSQRFIIIPYDYDNTFSIDWFNVNWSAADPYAFPKAVAGARPLWDRIITVPQYRDLYTHFLRFSNDTAFALRFWEKRLDRLKDSLLAPALEDPYRTQDYGFTVADFMNSFGTGPYSNQHVKMGIKQYVNARSTSLTAKLTSVNSPPMVYRISSAPQYPTGHDSVTVFASAFGAAGLRELWVQYTPAGGAAQLYAMHPSPVPGTKKVEEADRWSAVLPPLGAGGSGTVRIVVNDSLNRTQIFPRSSSIRLAASGAGSGNVVINEFLADNSTIADPAGQFDDWVELYNRGNTTVALTGRYLTDKATSLTKWRFKQPGLTIPAGGRVVVWCDEDSGQTGIHTNFKLSAGGEFLALTDSDGVTVLDSLSFGAQQTNIAYGRSPDGTGNWGRMLPTPNAANGAVLTTVADATAVPQHFTLTIHPNPFNPAAQITVTVPERNTLVLEIFDTMGRLVWSHNAGTVNAGSIGVMWNGVANNGKAAGTGAYFLRVRLGSKQKVQRLLLMK